MKEISLFLLEELEVLVDDSQENGIECSDLINEILLQFYGKKNELETSLFQQQYANIEAFLAANHIDFSDKRNKGGSLWVVDNPRARLDVMRAEKLYDVKFEFTRDGGRSSKRKAAWYLDPGEAYD